MDNTIKVAAASGLLLLVGTATGQTRNSRVGASAVVQQREFGQCWKIAQRTKMTEEQATGNLVTGYLIGGVVGVMIASSSNEDANKNPKSDFRRQVHDECMAKRGYRQLD
jgi:hypothetical protein